MQQGYIVDSVIKIWYLILYSISGFFRDGMIKRALYDKSLQKTLQINQEKYASTLDLHAAFDDSEKSIDDEDEKVDSSDETDPELRKRAVFTVGLSN